MLISADTGDDEAIAASGILFHKWREKFNRVSDGGICCLADHDCQSILQDGGASLPLASVHAVLVLLSARTLLAHAQIIVIIAGMETTGLQMVLVTVAGFTFPMQDFYEKILPVSSCFLLTTKGDSIEDIYDTVTQCALISKSAGGIGVAISNVRTKGGYIRGTNGNSNDLVPMLRNFDETARYVDQGGGQHQGSFAMYFEPWHADVFDFLELRKNHG